MSGDQETKLNSGHESSLLEGDEWTNLQKDFPAYRDGLVRLTPGRWLLCSGFLKYADRLYDFKFRKGDVVVMTYPKCGTTWTQEIVWTMRNNPDLQNPEAEHLIMERVPFMEIDMISPKDAPQESEDSIHNEMFKKLCPGADPRNGVNLQLAEATLDPRTLKTHLPLSLFRPSLLENAKVVYVARNPKDTLLSYLHHHRLFKGQHFEGTLETFADYFVQDNLLYGPYWLHLKEAWERRDHPNMHFVFYEDMKADIMGELKKLDAFLGTRLTQEQLENVAKYTSFGEMKSKNLVLKKEMIENKNFVNQEVLNKDGGFFRQGKSGEWKTKLTPELVQKMDSWIAEKCDFGIKFQ